MAEDLGKCQDCKKRKAQIVYSANPMLTLTHGWGGRNICRRCFIIRLKSHIKECEKQLAEEEKLLRKEA